jgi:hypothetical protein
MRFSSFTRVGLLVGLWVALLLTTGNQRGATPAPADSAGQQQRQLKRVVIDSIEGEHVNPQDGKVIDTFQENRKLQVIISGEVGADDDVWLLVSALDGQTYYVFGPGKPQQNMDQISWLFPEVTLPYPGKGQMRQLIFQAAVLPKDHKPTATVDSLKDFPVVSWPPVPVVVLKWVPKAGALMISSIGGKEVEPGFPMSVDATAEVTGTQPQSGQGKVYLILHPVDSSLWRVAGEAENTGEDKWRCRDVALAEVGQPQWRYVDVFAVRSAEPLERGPIEYNSYLEDINISSPSVRVWVKDDDVIPSKKSAKVELSRYITPDGQVRSIGQGQQGVIKLNDAEFSLQGTVKELPQGKILKAVLNPVGTPMWVVQEGSALVSQTRTLQEGTTPVSVTEWNLPRVHLESPGDMSATRFRLVIGLADTDLKPGVVSYANWQSRCIVASPVMTLELEKKAGEHSTPTSEMTLSIVKVAGIEVDSSNEVKVASRGPVVVQAEGVPAQAQVWIGKNQSDQDSWRFVPATRMSEDTWVADDMSFGGRSAHSNNHASPANPEMLTAIISQTSLPVHDSDSASWPLYAWAVSPKVKVFHPPTLSQSIGAFLSSPPAWLVPLTASLTLLALALFLGRRFWRTSLSGAGAGRMGKASHAPALGQAHVTSHPSSAGLRTDLPVWILGVILVVGLFIMIGNSLLYFLLPLLILALLLRQARNSQMIALAAGTVRNASEAILTHVQGQIQGTPKPHAVRSVFGLILLGLGLFAIVGYFPIYRHILQSALHLSREQSHSLALLLIVFIGLTGVVADVTVRYGRESDPEDSPISSQRATYRRDDGQFGYYLWISLLMLIALALLGFQSILYLEFYKSRAAEGSQIPFAFGAAALFIAGIEILNFYWSSRLALDFIAWLFVNVFLLGPPALMARAASLVEQGWRDLPSRTPKEQPALDNTTPPQMETISEDEAKEIANVYILTNLGDHLRAGPASLDQAQRDWRIPVMDKESGYQTGELIIRAGTQEAQWHQSHQQEGPHAAGQVRSTSSP